MFHTRPVVTTDGTTLGVHEVPGNGHLVVALHGFTGDGTTMIPLLERVRNGRPAMAIDLIGHGLSQSPDYLESYSMPSVVDQVLSIIGPHQPGTVHLIGYSMGGRVALSLGARAPWYFGSITTLSSTPGIENPVERAQRHGQDLALAEHLDEVGLETFIDEWLALPLFENYVAGLTPDQREQTRKQRNQASSLGLSNSLRALGTGAMPPVWNALRSIRSPILSLAGEQDSRYVDIGRRIQESAHDGRFYAVEDAGHVAHYENPTQVCHLIAQFLQHCEDINQQGEPA